MKLVGTGSYVPAKRFTNFDMEKVVDTSDEWIVQRTGIRERRFAAPDEAVSDLAKQAALRAFEMAGTNPEDLDLIITATVTADTCCPSAACWLQSKLNAPKAVAFDVTAACSGFLYGLEVAESLLHYGGYKNALLCGAEIMSRIVNWEDRSTCILFGDGAGAAVLQREHPGGHEVIKTMIYSEGACGNDIMLPGGGSSTTPISHESVDAERHTLTMDGQKTYRLAVRHMVDVAKDILKEVNLDPDDIAIVIPHQANLRILEGTAKLLGLPMSKVYVTIDRYGNISSASIPISLDEAVRAGAISPGDFVLLVGFGGGLTWGASVIRWGQNSSLL